MNDRSKANALFIDTTNSARSQIAEALFRHHAGDAYHVHSAGIDPQPINSYTFLVMEEIGIPLTGQEPKNVSVYLGKKHFGYVFTVCDYAQNRCPSAWLMAQHHTHWDIIDPLKAQGTEEKILDTFRAARDQLDRRIKAWLAERKAAAV